MTPPNLAAARAKRDWGDHYLQTLGKEIREWGDPNSNPIITRDWKEDFDNRYSLVPFESAEPMPRDWPFVIGDIVSNYRAALNYAAYELVPAKVALTERHLRNIQFPIVEPSKNPTAKTFLAENRWVHKRNPSGLPVKYLRAVSPFQPYPSRRHSRWPLDALRVLSNRDKHRQPLLTAQIVRITGAHSEPRENETGVSIMPFKLVLLRGRHSPKPGTYVARLDWAEGFHPVRAMNLSPLVSDKADVGVDLKFTARVALADFRPCEVLHTLQGIADAIEQILEAVESV